MFEILEHFSKGHIFTLFSHQYSQCFDFFLAGLTPYISNEVGMFVDTTFSTLNNEPRNAVAGGNKTNLHRFKSSKSEDDMNMKVAFPNDRAQSVRPSDRQDQYK